MPIGAAGVIHIVSFIFPEKSVFYVSRGAAIYWSQLIAFCVLPSTSLVLFRVFYCIEFPDNTSWLAADLENSCESETYQGMLAYTIVFLFVYPVGVPLYFFVILYPKREAIRALDRTKPVPAKLRKYQFLFDDYASNYCKPILEPSI